MTETPFTQKTQTRAVTCPLSTVRWRWSWLNRWFGKCDPDGWCSRTGPCRWPFNLRRCGRLPRQSWPEDETDLTRDQLLEMWDKGEPVELRDPPSYYEVLLMRGGWR